MFKPYPNTGMLNFILVMYHSDIDTDIILVERNHVAITTFPERNLNHYFPTFADGDR